MCGSDHVTYRNVCDLKRAACVKRSNVTVISQLPCGELVLHLFFTIDPLDMDIMYVHRCVKNNPAKFIVFRPIFPKMADLACCG